MNKLQKLYAFMVGGAAVGLVASFLQMLEKLTLLKNKDALLSCNINRVFSCTNVLNAPQSSVFGFPNSLMCIVLFTVFLSIGLVGLTRGVIGRKLRFVIQGLSLFTLGFGLWFLWQSTYRIGALCIYCVFCFAGMLFVNASWLQINAADYPLRKTHHRQLNKWIKNAWDIYAWLALAIIVALAMIIKFR